MRIESSQPENTRSEISTDAKSSERLNVISTLLDGLAEVEQSEAAKQKRNDIAYQNKLVEVRLGMASALFVSLRAKHFPTATHSLRVALGCSSWSLARGDSEEVRDLLEVAALLHDIGKIGVPDEILTKAGKLLPEEVATLNHHRQTGKEILKSFCASAQLIDSMYYALAWYDGSRSGFDKMGDSLPVGARMLAIVDAFDSMTTEHVYRHAMSRDRAMSELFTFAGSQFDPDLVKQFCQHINNQDVQLSAGVASRWLNDLANKDVNLMWSATSHHGWSTNPSVDRMFQQKLVDSMDDGVIFVDSRMKVLLWNRGAERLTGIVGASVFEKQWLPSLVEMRDEQGGDIIDSECPVARATRLEESSYYRVGVRGRGNQRVMIDLQVNPVVSKDSLVHGAIVLLHDASSQVTLEERVVALHTKATQDPLTKVANRAEFDRAHEEFVASHLADGIPCSLIICDLDFFKRVNDDYGHQAGDAALMSFASLLKRLHRAGDLVARYGGEEFVMLCANCDNATATARAEEIRATLESIPQPMLGDKSLTASFGVTELQEGDSPETMLRRSDRALLEAKEKGRNRVVQLGSGMQQSSSAPQKSGIVSWLKGGSKENATAAHLVTSMPIEIVVEKLRGFVADLDATILEVDGNRVTTKLNGRALGVQKKRSDRPLPFKVEFDFQEVGEEEVVQSDLVVRTAILVNVEPIRNRDRRRSDLNERAGQLISSIKSYFMASDIQEKAKQKVERAVDQAGER